MAEAVESPFDRSPDQVISEIFNILPLETKKKARLVCRRWCAILDTNEFYDLTAFHSILSQTTAKYFFNSNLKMESVKMSKMCRSMFRPESKLELQPIKNGIIGSKNSEVSLINFFTIGCEQATSLSILKFSLEKLRKKTLSKILENLWDKMTQLSLDVTLGHYKYERGRLHLENTNVLLRNVRIPSLKDMNFSFIYRYNKVPQGQGHFQKLWIGFYTFLANHSTLKNLTCEAKANLKKDSLDLLYRFPEMPPELDFQNLKLDSLTFKLEYIGSPHFLVCPILAGRGLKVLNLNEEGEYRGTPSWNPQIEESFYERIGQICQDNAETLQHVIIRSFLSPYIVSIPFNFQSLINCKSLEQLELYPCDDYRHIEIPMSLEMQMNLKIFKIDSRCHDQRAIIDIIRGNSKTLQNIMLRCHYVEIDFSWFEDCKSLQHLELFTWSDFKPRRGRTLDLHMKLKTLKITSVGVDDTRKYSFPPAVPDIIQQNRKTLSQLTIEALQHQIDFHWFKDCSSLDYIELKVANIHPQEGIHFPSNLNLTTLKIATYSIDNTSIIPTLIHQSSENLKHLDLHDVIDIYKFRDHLSKPGDFYKDNQKTLATALSECGGLKSLNISHLTASYTRLTKMYFPNLTYFEFGLWKEEEGTEQIITDWMARCMPNVITIKVGLYCVDAILFTRLVQNMTKLKKLVLYEQEDKGKQLESFCSETPGVKLVRPYIKSRDGGRPFPSFIYIHFKHSTKNSDMK